MRRALPILLLLAACAAEEEEPLPPVERSFTWEAPEGSTVHGAVALPSGETFVQLIGEEGTVGLFLSETGTLLDEFLLDDLCDECAGVIPALPLAIGDDAFFGAVEGGEPAFIVDGARRAVRHLFIENPRSLQVGHFYLDGRRATVAANGRQLLLPGEEVVELSVEGIVIKVHPTPPMEALAHVRDDVYGFLDEDGVLGGWRVGDREVQGFETLQATALDGGGGFTVLALRQGMTLELFVWDDPLRSLEAVFLHEVALSVAPAAGRVLVGVQERPLADDLDEEELAEAPAPGALFVYDDAGRKLGTFEAPEPISTVHLAVDGTRGVATWSGGVLGLHLR